MDASPAEPTPQDLLNLKPEISAPIESAEYANAYKSGLRRVSRAFTYGQMTQLANLLRLEGRLPGTSRQLAAILLERSWGWINPANARELKEKPPESTATSAIIPSCCKRPLTDYLIVPLRPDFLFLLMGRGEPYFVVESFTHSTV
jgi:hypothetical protein